MPRMPRPRALDAASLAAKRAASRFSLPLQKASSSGRIDAAEKAVSPAGDNVPNAVNLYNVYTGYEHGDNSRGTTVA